MNEIEQLQLQNKCEQLELLVGQLAFINAVTLSNYSGYKKYIRGEFEKKCGGKLTTPDQIAKLDKNDLEELLITCTSKLVAIEVVFKIIDNYMSNVQEPYNKILHKITEERKHTSVSEDFKYLLNIANMKEEDLHE